MSAKVRRVSLKSKLFIFFWHKDLSLQKKSVPLHCKSAILGYGVMVTLQILVLPFLVRVRVAQLTHEARAETKHIWAMPCEKEEDKVN